MFKFGEHRFLCEWIQKNRDKIECIPIVDLVRHNLITAAFRNVDKRIVLKIDKTCNVAVCVYYKRKLWDIITDFDVYYRRNISGLWSCKCCIEPLLFKTHKQIFIEHSLSDLEDWIIENLVKNKWIVLHGKIGHYRYCEIVDTKEMSKQKCRDTYIDSFKLRTDC